MPDFIRVEVGKFPGSVHQIGLNGGRTVRDALNAANIALEPGYVIYVNDQRADLATELGEGDQVILTQKITGN